MAKIKPLFWITGNYYDCCKTWKDIISRLGDVAVDILDCGYKVESSNLIQPATACDVILLLKNKDMFDDRPRVIKMKGIPNDYHLIADYLHLVNNKNVLVVDGPIGYRAKPPSKRMITAATSRFYKTFSTKGKVFQFPMEGKNRREAVTHHLHRDEIRV